MGQSLENPVIPQIVKIFPAFYGYPMFRDMFTRVCHLSLSIAKLVLSTLFLPISLRSNIIRSFHLHHFLPSGVFFLGFCTQNSNLLT